MESQRTSWMARVDDDRSFVTDGSLTKWMMLRHRPPPTVRFLRLFLTSSCIPRRGSPPPSPPLSLFPSSAVQEGPRTDGPEGPTPPWEGPPTVRPFARESEKGNGPPFFRRFYPSDGSSRSVLSVLGWVGPDPFVPFDPPTCPLSVSRDPTPPLLPCEYSLHPTVARSDRTVDSRPGRPSSVTVAIAAACGPHAFQEAASGRQTIHVRTIKRTSTDAPTQVAWTWKRPRKSREGWAGWAPHGCDTGLHGCRKPGEDWQTHGTTSLPSSWLCIVFSTSTADEPGLSQHVPVARPNHATAAVRLALVATRGATPRGAANRRHHRCHECRSCCVRAVTFVVLFR